MNLLEIKITKGVLYLTEAELTSLLSRDRELWTKALKRGKFQKRADNENRRPPKRYRRDPSEQEFIRRMSMDD